MTGIPGRTVRATLTLTVVGSVLLSTALMNPPMSQANPADIAINGTFEATSNGDWAQTRDSYHDEVSVRSIWTITSTCQDMYHCTGTVSSDAGWTAPARRTSTTWLVEREHPHWIPCADGSTFAGRQTYRFYQIDEAGQLDMTGHSRIFAGIDKTLGVSGACGVNEPLSIAMPFRLVQVSP